MGSWVLRPEIDGEIANRSFGHTSLFYGSSRFLVGGFEHFS
jgi:hypothetical protein